MNAYIYKRIISLVFIGLFMFLINPQQAHGQQEIKYVSACHIFDNLVFGLRFNKSIDEINRLLIKEIQERGVDFTINSEEENSFKKIGASDLLIKAVREKFSTKLREQIDLYKKFTDNYDGKTVEQKKIAVDAAKEYIKKFSEEEDGSKVLVEYFRKVIPALEKQLVKLTQN